MRTQMIALAVASVAMLTLGGGGAIAAPRDMAGSSQLGMDEMHAQLPMTAMPDQLPTAELHARMPADMQEQMLAEKQAGCQERHAQMGPEMGAHMGSSTGQDHGQHRGTDDMVSAG